MLQIDAVLYFAPILFQQAGLASVNVSFLASGVTGVVALVCTIPAQIWIDRWGRRKPLIIGGSAMVVCLLLIGALYARYGRTVSDGVQLTSGAAQWVVISMIYLFVANFSWSWAVVSLYFNFSQADITITVYILSRSADII
jgi:MFS family permease